MADTCNVGTRHQFRCKKACIYQELGVRVVKDFRDAFFRRAKVNGNAICLLSDVAKSVQRSTNATIAQVLAPVRRCAAPQYHLGCAAWAEVDSVTVVQPLRVTVRASTSLRLRAALRDSDMRQEQTPLKQRATSQSRSG